MDVLRRTRRWWVLAMALALAALTVATFTDRCGRWDPASPRVRARARAQGPLRVGAAVEPLEPRYPVTVAGYPPWRPTASGAAFPLAARATAVEVGGELLTLVTLDVLLVTAPLQRAVQAGLPGRVWLLATHTHSGPGGHDARPAAELAALGVHDARDEARLVAAARAAAIEARARLAPARLEVVEGDLAGLAVPRSGASVDRRLTAVRFVGARPLAQWLILTGHPTLVDPGQAALDPDWPGRLAALAEAAQGPVTLVLQGAGGNASVDRAAADTPEAFAARVQAALPPSVPAAPGAETSLAWAEVAYGLPHPDGSRLAPGWLRRPLENVLCAEAEREAVVAVLRLGAASLLFTSVEPTAEAGVALEARAGVGRSVGLASAYDGYLETGRSVEGGTGEARRQYFGPEFMSLVGEAAALAGRATDP